jgi:uncharacterized membrane protein (UPF0127 family)
LIRHFLFSLTFLCLSVLPHGLAWGDGTLPVETVVIETGQGRTAFEAEIADTPVERSKGLMFRDSLPEGHGMLFDFGKARPVAMWMKNTRISLDMIFADGSGRVIGVAENTVPFSTTTLSVDEPVKAVFEVSAGTARRIGLKSGGKLIHPIFMNGG